MNIVIILGASSNLQLVNLKRIERWHRNPRDLRSGNISANRKLSPKESKDNLRRFWSLKNVQSLSTLCMAVTSYNNILHHLHQLQWWVEVHVIHITNALSFHHKTSSIAKTKSWCWLSKQTWKRRRWPRKLRKRTTNRERKKKRPNKEGRSKERNNTKNIKSLIFWGQSVFYEPPHCRLRDHFKLNLSYKELIWSTKT